MPQIEVTNSDYIENRTFDEINVGDSAHPAAHPAQRGHPHVRHHVRRHQSGARRSGIRPFIRCFTEVIAHGMWGGALISTLLGTQFPGPGTIYKDQTLHFSRPVRVGDTLTVTVRCDRKFDHNKHMILDCLCQSARTRR
jgi:phosphate acetyltransferase